MPSPSSKTKAPSSLYHPLIIAILLLNTAGILVLFFKTELDTMMTMQEVELAHIQLKDARRPTTADGGRMMAPSAVTRTIAHGLYEFDIPASWEQRSSDGRIDFYENGKKIAALSCPMPETGYEAWDFEQTTRHFEKDGKEIGIQLLLGTPTIDGDSELALLSMFPQADFSAVQTPDDIKATCQLTGWKAPGQFTTFRQIYASIR